MEWLNVNWKQLVGCYIGESANGLSLKITEILEVSERGVYARCRWQKNGSQQRYGSLLKQWLDDSETIYSKDGTPHPLNAKLKGINYPTKHMMENLKSDKFKDSPLADLYI